MDPTRRLVLLLVSALIGCGPSTAIVGLPTVEGAEPTGVVEAAPPTVTTQSLPPAVKGQPYSQQLAARDGVGPYSWRLEAPTVPWLNIDSAGRLFSVSLPTRVSQDDGEEVTVTVTDAKKTSAVQRLLIRVDCVDGEVEFCFVPKAELLACVEGQTRCVAGRPTGCESPSVPVTSTSVDACDADCRQCDGSAANACTGGRCTCGDQPSCARGDGGVKQCCGKDSAASCVAMNDPNNCGSCGTNCDEKKGARVNVVSACTTETYVCLYACKAGFGNCAQPGNVTDGNGAVGCPHDLNNDPAHCGSACNVCPALANAAPVCNGGACGFACNVGFDNCNGNAADGCEDPLTGARNCGACGVGCANTEVCSNKRCIPNPTGCTTSRPILCEDGRCVAEQRDCNPITPTCPPSRPVECPDGRCATNLALCGGILTE